MPPDDKDPDNKPAGRVRHDSTGRAVWEWAMESGRHAIDSTSRLLKRLEMPGLKLAEDETRKEKQLDEEAVDPATGKSLPPTFGGPRESDPLAGSRRGFDPYNSRTPAARPATRKPPAPPAKPRITQPPAAPKTDQKPGLLGRLFGKK